MVSELGLTVFLNGYSPILLNAAYYVSESIYLLFIVTLSLAIRKKGMKSGIYAGFVIALVGAADFLLKALFNIPRPNSASLIILDKETDASFPSNHAGLSFAASAMSEQSLLYIWAVLISISRLILGVHYLRDVVAGAILGYVIGQVALKYEKKAVEAFFDSENAFETRRKLFHGILGTAIAIAAYFVPRAYAIYILFTAVVVALAISRCMKARIPLGIMDTIIGTFERKKDIGTFPLKGTLFFLVGCLISIVLYSTKIAAASIIILALGDCFSTLIGKPFGKTRHAHNVGKSIEGSLSGFFAALAGAAFFVPFAIAVIGAFSGMIIESFDLALGKVKIDDNLIIPVISGAVMVAAISLGI